MASINKHDIVDNCVNTMVFYTEIPGGGCWGAGFLG